MALLQKKGSKSSSGGARVSAMELLKSTNPLARRVTEFSTTASTTPEGGEAVPGNSKPNDQWTEVQLTDVNQVPFAVDKATNQFYNAPPNPDGALWLICPARSLQLMIDHLHCPIKLEHIFGQNGPSHGWSAIVPRPSRKVRKLQRTRFVLIIFPMKGGDFEVMMPQHCTMFSSLGMSFSTEPGWTDGWGGADAGNNEVVPWYIFTPSSIWMTTTKVPDDDDDDGWCVWICNQL